MARASEERLAGGNFSVVHRSGGEVLRGRHPWSVTTIGLLLHLNEAGFAASPCPVGNGFAADGRERLAFMDAQPQGGRPWSAEGIYELGQLHRRLHELASTFRPDHPTWSSGWPRGLPLHDTDVVIGHGDPGPWNVLARDDRSMLMPEHAD